MPVYSAVGSLSRVTVPVPFNEAIFTAGLPMHAQYNSSSAATKPVLTYLCLVCSGGPAVCAARGRSHFCRPYIIVFYRPIPYWCVKMYVCLAKVPPHRKCRPGGDCPFPLPCVRCCWCAVQSVWSLFSVWYFREHELFAVYTIQWPRRNMQRGNLTKCLNLCVTDSSKTESRLFVQL